MTFGRERVITLIDTGAEVSVMKDTLLKRIPQLYVDKITKPHYTRCVGPEGSPLYPTKTAYVVCDFGDVKVTHPFLVVHNVRKELIIGSDFLIARKAKVDLEDMTLQLQGEDAINLFLLAGDEQEPRVPVIATPVLRGRDRATLYPAGGRQRPHRQRGHEDGARQNPRVPNETLTRNQRCWISSGRQQIPTITMNHAGSPEKPPEGAKKSTKTAKYRRRRQRRAERREQNYTEQMLYGPREEMEEWLQRPPVRKARGKPSWNAHTHHNIIKHPMKEEKVCCIPTITVRRPMPRGQPIRDIINPVRMPRIGSNEVTTANDHSHDAPTLPELTAYVQRRLIRKKIEKHEVSRERQPRTRWNHHQRLERRQSQTALREGLLREKTQLKQHLERTMPHLRTKRERQIAHRTPIPSTKTLNMQTEPYQLYDRKQRPVTQIPRLATTSALPSMRDQYWMVPEPLPMETEDPTLPHLVWDDDVECHEEEDGNDVPQTDNKEDQIGGAKLNVGHEDPAVRQRLKELLKKNEHLFAPTDADLGRTPLVEFSIDTGTSAPIRQHPYKVEGEKRETIDEHLDSMLDAGVIEPSASPWSSPVLLVPKPKEEKLTGKPAWRFCIDYRQLNKVTVKNAYPLPNITDIIDALEGASIFSSLDLKSGYWQIPLRETDKEKTAFITHRGQFQFNRVPFGLANAPSVFANLIAAVLSGLEYKICLAYLDDIIIYSNTVEEHLENLQKVFDRLEQAGLKLKPSKCEYLCSKLDFLGHVISADGVGVDPYKVKTILAKEPPTNIRGVRAFLGMCSYYRKFIKGMAKIAKPLTELTKKTTPFEWTTDCQNAFDTLKAALQTAPTLAYPKEAEDHTYVLYTHGGDTALTAILTQRSPAGQEKAVHYYSSVLTPTEQKYPEAERECYALIKASDKFRRYLKDNHFILYSARAPHQALIGAKKTNRRLQRWAAVLSTLKFQHRTPLTSANEPPKDAAPCISYIQTPRTEDHASPSTLIGAEVCAICQRPAEVKDDQWSHLKSEIHHHMTQKRYHPIPQVCDTCTAAAAIATTTSPADGPREEGAKEPETNVQTPLEELTSYPTPTSTGGANAAKRSKHRPNIRTLINVEDARWNKLDGIVDVAEPDPKENPLADAPNAELRRAQQQDKEIQDLIKQITDGTTVKDYTLGTDGLLYHYAAPIKLDPEPRTQIVVPRDMVPAILAAYHNPFHWGIEKNYAILHARFFWKTMYQDCIKHVQKCTNCAHARLQKSKAPLQNERPLPAHPFVEVVMDLIGELPATKHGNYKYIATFVDVFSGWPEAFPLRDKTAESVARVIATEIIPRHSTISILRSDNGLEFCNRLVDELSVNLGIQRITCLPYAPQSNGIVERFNQTLTRGIKKRNTPYEEYYTNWHLHIPAVLFAHRVAPHERTRLSPFSVVYGREPYLMADEMFAPKLNYNGDEFHKKQLWRMHKAFKLVRAMTAKAREEQRKQYNKKVDEIELEEGTNVWYYDPRNVRGPSKIHSKWRPMYKVIGFKTDTAVRIQHQPTGKELCVHRNYLRPVDPEYAWEIGFNPTPAPIGAKEPTYKGKPRRTKKGGGDMNEDEAGYSQEEEPVPQMPIPDGHVPNDEDHDSEEEEDTENDPRATARMQTEIDRLAEKRRKHQEQARQSCAPPKPRPPSDDDSDSDDDTYPRLFGRIPRGTTGFSKRSQTTTQDPTPSTSRQNHEDTQSQDSGHPRDTPPEYENQRSHPTPPTPYDEHQSTRPQPPTGGTPLPIATQKVATRPATPTIEEDMEVDQASAEEEQDLVQPPTTPPVTPTSTSKPVTPRDDTMDIDITPERQPAHSNLIDDQPSPLNKLDDTTGDNTSPEDISVKPDEQPLPNSPADSSDESEPSKDDSLPNPSPASTPAPTPTGRQRDPTPPPAAKSTDDLSLQDDESEPSDKSMPTPVTEDKLSPPAPDRTNTVLPPASKLESAPTTPPTESQPPPKPHQTDPASLDADDEAESDEESQTGVVVGNTYNRPIIPKFLRPSEMMQNRTGPAASTRSRDLYRRTLREGQRGVKRPRSPSSDREVLKSRLKKSIYIESEDETPPFPPPVVEGKGRETEEGQREEQSMDITESNTTATAATADEPPNTYYTTLRYEEPQQREKRSLTKKKCRQHYTRPQMGTTDEEDEGKRSQRHSRSRRRKNVGDQESDVNMMRISLPQRIKSRMLNRRASKTLEPVFGYKWDLA